MTKPKNETPRGLFDISWRRFLDPKGIETATKVAAIASVVAYGVGMLAINVYLLQFGVSDFSLFRARFILAGGVTTLVSVAVLAVGGTAGFFVAGAVLPERLLSAVGIGDMTKPSERLMVGFAAVVFFGVAWFVGEQGGMGTLPVRWVGFIATLVFGFILARARDRRRGVLDSDKLTPGVLVLVALVLPVLPGETEGYLLENVPEQLGGVSSTKTVLLISDDGIDGLTALGVPFDAGSGHTDALDVVFSGEDFVIVRVPDQNATVVIDRDLVLATKVVD